MIDKPSVEELTKNGDSVYTLCIMAAKRARQLNNGAKKLKKSYSSSKPVSQSMEEIADSKLKYRSTRL